MERTESWKRLDAALNAIQKEKKDYVFTLPVYIQTQQTIIVSARSTGEAIAAVARYYDSGDDSNIVPFGIDPMGKVCLGLDSMDQIAECMDTDPICE